MNNVGKKILILGAVIVVSVVAILVFMLTIAEPPKEVDFSNLHNKSVANDIDEISTFNSFAKNDSLYNIVRFKMKLYKNEEFITDSDDLDLLTKNLINRFVPVFKDWCNQRFSNRVWYVADHTSMTQHINQLRCLTINGSVRAISEEHDHQLREVERVLKEYKEANRASNNVRFTSIESAKEQINTANRYRERSIYPELSNCEDLMNSLSSVGSRIGQNHWLKLQSEVKKLANYQSMYKSEFEKLSESVTEQVTKYFENKDELYGPNSKNTKELEDLAQQYIDNAKNFFEQQQSSNESYDNYW